MKDKEFALCPVDKHGLPEGFLLQGPGSYMNRGTYECPIWVKVTTKLPHLGNGPIIGSLLPQKLLTLTCFMAGMLKWCFPKLSRFSERDKSVLIKLVETSLPDLEEVRSLVAQNAPELLNRVPRLRLPLNFEEAWRCPQVMRGLYGLLLAKAKAVQTYEEYLENLSLTDEMAKHLGRHRRRRLVKSICGRS